jgi:anti-sigma regulatory factor (Ser/Thr protein kinase)
MTWERTYPPEESAATRARSDVRKALPPVGVTDEVRDAVEIVVGELASNAIRHAATEFAVCVEVEPGHVRVAVYDADTRPPALLAAGPDATSGRGLQIVAALASAWGWESAERQGISGKAVWAEVALPREGRGMTEERGGNDGPDGEARVGGD